MIIGDDVAIRPNAEPRAEAMGPKSPGGLLLLLMGSGMLLVRRGEDQP